MEEKIPQSFIEDNSQNVNVNYKSFGENEFGFSIPDYNKTSTLIIDPTPYLMWGTYYGGSSDDEGNGITTDYVGNVMITGWTGSTSAIATSGAYQTALSGTPDCFICKFNSTGNRIWATYYGGTGNDEGLSITSDGTGNIFITGLTTSTLGIASSGAFQTTYGGGPDDGFIAKFNSSGGRQWATYSGGSGPDFGRGISTDKNGNVLIIGTTGSSSAIATSGAYQTTYSGGTRDAFIAKFISSGSLQWATYFGGNLEDDGFGIATDTNGNIFITGSTTSTTGIATSSAYQTINGGGSIDGFIAKFSSSGSLQWSTYYGGSGFDGGDGITTDKIGNVLITGTTNSTTGIATIGTHQSSLSGGGDAFITKFNSSGSRLWGSYYGGTNNDGGNGISTDSVGNVYITGSTNSTSGIASLGSYQTLYSGGSTYGDAFIAEFSPSGSRVWSSYYGGSGDEIVTGIIATANGNAFITGYTNSTLGIATLNSHQSVYGGGIYDAFIGKFGNCSNSYLSATSNSPVCEKSPVQFTVSSNGIFFSWTGPNGFSSVQKNAVVNNSILSSAGKYSLIMLDSVNGCMDTASVNVTVRPTPKVGFGQNNFSHCLVGNNFIFNDTSTISSGTKQRLWKFSTGDTSALSIVNKTFPNAGNYSIKLIETSNLNCKDSLTKTFTVFPQTNIGFTINHSNQCLQNIFLLTDTSTVSSGSFTEFWKLGDGDTSKLSIVNKSYNAGSYNVKLINKTDSGCVDSVQQMITVSPYPKPNAGFTQNNLNECFSGNIFVLNDTSTISSGTISRLWNLGSGDTSTSSASNKLFPSAGTYTIKLYITSDHSCTDSSIKTFTVYPQPKVGFTQIPPGRDAQCLSGNNFVLNDTSTISSGNISRLWDFSDGDTSTSSVSAKFFASAGTYQIKLFETSDHNCVDSSIKTFTVYPQPNVGFTQNNQAQCFSGNIFLLNDTSNISSGFNSRLWYFSDGDTSTSSVLNKSFSGDGTYSIKLFEISNHNCIDSAIKTFAVFPQPVSGFTQNIFALCLTGNDFILTDTSTVSSGVLTRLWNFGDSTTSASGNVNKSYSKEGIYSVKLLVTSKNNCVDSTTKIFTIYPQTKIGFTINNPDQCEYGNNYLFTDTSNISNGVFSRLWDLDYGYPKTLTSISINKTYSWGKFNIKLSTTTNHGCVDSIQKTINIYSNPVVDFYSDPTGQCFIGNKTLFINKTNYPDGNSIHKCLWRFDDGTTDTSENPAKSFVTPGIHPVFLQVTNSNNCFDTSNHYIILDKNPDKPQILAVTTTQLQSSYYSPGIYQWFLNNDSIPNANTQTVFVHQNGMYRVAVGNGCTNISDPLNITLFNNVRIIVIPNPNNGNFTLDFIALPGEKQIEVYNMHGMFINRFSTSENIFEINSFLSSGMYVLKVVTGTGTFNVKVIVD
ncbi:MAG: PKD domain-containing protein [Bacteroidia bacterium]